MIASTRASSAATVDAMRRRFPTTQKARLELAIALVNSAGPEPAIAPVVKMRADHAAIEHGLRVRSRRREL